MSGAGGAPEAASCPERGGRNEEASRVYDAASGTLFSSERGGSPGSETHPLGHCSLISSLCMSEDRRWLATADKGPDSLVIVWDTYSGIPVRTIFDCHPEGGVAAIALSRDSKLLVSVGAGAVQRACVWDWTSDADRPLCETDLGPELGRQQHILFHPNDSSQLLSNSDTHVLFYSVEKDRLCCSIPEISDKTFSKAVGSVSQSVFWPQGARAISATMAGNLLLWDVAHSAGAHQPHTREVIKLIPLQDDGITVLTLSERKTLLGPIYGSPVEKMAILPESAEGSPHSRYLVFVTTDKVGLQILPLDGNPYKSFAIIGHPAGVSAFACSCDGKYVFTAGGPDYTVFSWEANLGALEAAASLGGQGLIPFYSLLEGGRDGRFFKEMEDYFYYCQLRSEGIHLMKKRRVSTRIPLKEVPFMMRALGFYPTEQELMDMQNEVKFSRYAETGKYITDIDLEDFIKLFVNHRPAFGVSRKEIQHVLEVLGDPNENGEHCLNREELLELLQTTGENMTEEELAECFTTLLGRNPEGGRSEMGESAEQTAPAALLESEFPAKITMDMLTADILGFPETMAEAPFSESEGSPTGSRCSPGSRELLVPHCS